MSKTVGKKGMDLIKKWEGCRLKAYKDSVGVATIGWGTTRYPNGKKVQLGDKITQAEADAMLKRQVQDHADGMTKYINTNILNQNQYDALASFHYNLGANILKGSLLKYLKEEKWNKAAAEMQLYNKGRINGVLKVIKGLSNRRKSEVELFNTPVIIKVSAPKKPVIKAPAKKPAKKQKVTRYKVTAGELNIRKSASNNGKVLGQLSKNDTVQVVSIDKAGWAKVKSNEKYVFVYSKYLIKN